MAQQDTPDLVAEHATREAELEHHGVTLLGTFGADAEPEAILRLADGGIARVVRGDRVGAEVVQAIDHDAVVLARAGRARHLHIPGR
ncbi:amidophosphoribosyltransferase [Roseivivax sp. CAU 1761]